MRPIALFMTALIVFLAPAFATVSMEGDKVAEGVKLLRAGDYEAALLKFRDAQIEHPESAELHFNIGMALYKLERYEEARKSFESASFARNRDIEKKALFHIGNCLVKEGKLEAALKEFNRALQVDEQYQAAKVNREWVVRKLKELARRKKEQDKKHREERRIIEKVQELLQKQVQLHGVLRARMKVSGEKPAPTAIKAFQAVLDQEVPEEAQEALSRTTLPEFLGECGKSQGELLEDLLGILKDVAQKLEGPDAAAQNPQAQTAPNPELAKLKKALPHLEAAQKNMERAREAALDEQNVFGCHAGQEGAIQDLLAALNALMDELARLIRDQAELLSDSYSVAQKAEQKPGPPEGSQDHVAVAGPHHKSLQQGIRERTEQYTKGLEAHLEQLRQQAEQQNAPGGPGVQPGADPHEATRKVEKALTHLNKAADHMEQAEAFLEKPDFGQGVPAEKSALEELIKARAALSPPQKQQGQGENEQDQGQDKKDEGQEQNKEQQKDSDRKEKQNQDQKKKQDQGEEQKNQKEKQDQGAQGLTDEQAKKTLDQQKQREMDRRRGRRDERRRARRSKSRGVGKDW